MTPAFDEMVEALKGLHILHIGFENADNALKRDIGVETCVAGCGKCCMENTPYSRVIEAINAISVLTGQGKLRKAVSVAEGWLLENHKEARIYEGRPPVVVSPLIHQEWLNLRQTQCPFLQDSLQCMIHDVRPLTCRAFGVTYEVHDTCPRRPGKGETQSQFKYAKSDLLKSSVIGYWDQCREWKSEWVVSGFLPTLIYRAAEPEKFKKMILDNKIASAKIIGVNYDISLMWQPQIESLRQGKLPDLVAALR